jgi:hypothetical protein
VKVYLTSGKTVHGGWRVSDRKLREWAMEEGMVFVHPRALRDGTVSPDDFPMTVEVVPMDFPPPDALVLNPAPRGWAVYNR